MNTNKIEYLVFAGQARDLQFKADTIRGCKNFKYLGVIFEKSKDNRLETISIIGQGKM